MNTASPNPYGAQWGQVAAYAEADERTDFIRKTYSHLLCAILAFAGLETLLFSLHVPEHMLGMLQGSGRFMAFMVIGAFCLVSWVANAWAMSATSVPMQYAGLSLYVVAEAVIFMPILHVADQFFPGQQIIETAGLITLLMFGGLTAMVFFTKKDFSFLGGILSIVGLGLMGLALCSVFFRGLHLGMAYTIGVIGLACGYIVYDTSNVLHRYRIGQHVAAALALFASVALLFMYVLRLLMEMSRSNR